MSMRREGGGRTKRREGKKGRGKKGRGEKREKGARGEGKGRRERASTGGRQQAAGPKGLANEYGPKGLANEYAHVILVIRCKACALRNTPKDLNSDLRSQPGPQLSPSPRLPFHLGAAAKTSDVAVAPPRDNTHRAGPLSVARPPQSGVETGAQHTRAPDRAVHPRVPTGTPFAPRKLQVS
eukprot:COSAG06_NODE_17922_length_914_cov_1.088344_2_plen_181_part_00